MPEGEALESDRVQRTTIQRTMACVAVKRPCDHMMSTDAMMLDSPEKADIFQTAKRCRLMSPTSPRSVAGMHRARPRIDPSSLFQPPVLNVQADVDAHVAEAASKRQRHRRAGGDSAGHEASGALPDVVKEETVFTFEQVRSIVASALREKEAELTARYDEILQQRLQEHWAVFSKHNEDHIHQLMSSATSSYIN